MLSLFRARCPSDGGFDRPTIATFKSDHRTKVWSVDGAQGTHVLKRWLRAPVKQFLQLIVRNHPALRELRANRRLRQAQVRVVPIVDGGVEWLGLGCNVWLATPLTGQSLQHLLNANGTDQAQRERWIDAAVDVTVDLLDAGFNFKDLKSSNVVIDEAGHAWLIDVGAAYRGRSPRRIERTLEMMDRTLRGDAVDESLRRRFAEGVASGRQVGAGG